MDAASVLGTSPRRCFAISVARLPAASRLSRYNRANFLEGGWGRLSSSGKKLNLPRYNEMLATVHITEE